MCFMRGGGGASPQEEGELDWAMGRRKRVREKEVLFGNLRRWEKVVWSGFRTRKPVSTAWNPLCLKLLQELCLVGEGAAR